MIGLLGKKLGMTHVYDSFGRWLAVTAIQAGPCTILALREPEKDGYRAVQLGFEEISRQDRVGKPLAGQFKKVGAKPFRYVREFRLPDNDETPRSTKSKEDKEGQGQKELSVGQELTVELFGDNEIIDVTGVSIGKGFQGGMKRWGWSGGPKSHGSMSHRAPGSIGASTTPSRVLRGHHLPGHMGSETVTVQNLRIVRIDRERNLMLIEGCVPGSEESLVMVRRSVKNPGKIKKVHGVLLESDEEDAKKKTRAKRKQ